MHLMRQGWCIGLRLPVQLRANNHLTDSLDFSSVTYGLILPYGVVLPLRNIQALHARNKRYSNNSIFFICIPPCLYIRTLIRKYKRSLTGSNYRLAE